MHLDDLQCNDFFDAMDSLLKFVNRRFDVVPGFNMEVLSALDEAKAALIARTLWENQAVIEDYCLKNPDRLPSRLLDKIRLWEYAISGEYTLVRYQDGCAILMGEAGVFEVCGIVVDMDEVVGPAPARLQATLLPFDDRIVYDGFLQAFDLDGQDEVRSVQDEFETRVVGEGIKRTAAEFCSVADEFKRKRLSDDMDALLEDISREAQSKGKTEVLPAGFHRGVLADKNVRTDLESLRDEFEPSMLRKSEQAKLAKMFRDSYAIKVREMPDLSLESCLLTMKRDDLLRLASVFGVEGMPGNSSKARIVDAIIPAIFDRLDSVEITMLGSTPTSYTTIRNAAEFGDFSFSADELFDHMDIQPMPPCTFLFYVDKTYHLVVPTEIRPKLESIDYAKIDEGRYKMDTAVAFASSAAFFYGIMPFSELYERFNDMYRNYYTEEEFYDSLNTMIGANVVTAAFVDVDDVECVAYPTLTTNYVMSRVAREHIKRLNEKPDSDADGDDKHDGLYDEFLPEAIDTLQKELDNLLAVQRTLLEQHREIPFRPLSYEEVEYDPMDAIMANSSVVALRDFFDEHVPDWENDYTFADSLVEELVVGALEVADLNALINHMSDIGMDRCTDDPDILSRLITNVYNVVPSWENNGWSPKELMENITGRKIFYSKDGKVIKVGPEDPCPCGSGKKYRDCCGR